MTASSRPCPVVFALVVLLALGGAAASAAEQPVRQALDRRSVARPLPLRERCLTRNEKKHTLRFVASDGARLVGVVVGGGEDAIVIAHELRSNICSTIGYSRRLARAGYRVLDFDFRNTGSSARSRRAERLDLDVVAATTALRRQRGVSGVQLVGGSLGAAAVLTASPLIAPPPDVVVALSPPRTWPGLDALAAMRHSSVPVLIAAASTDEPFPDEARALFAASGAPDKRLEIVAGSDHGFALVRRRAPLEPVVAAFLAAHRNRTRQP
jgi:pimeloyl-ACP methyl ester carboxylesterase